MPTGDYPPHYPQPIPAFTTPEGSAQRGDRLIESLIQRISDLEVAVARLIGNPVVNLQADPTEGYAKWREEQVRGMMGQAAVAPQKPEAKWNDTEGLRSICSYINDTPALRSLLYDLDLLPEQVKPDSREGSHMLSIAEAWKANTKSSSGSAVDKVLKSLETHIDELKDRLSGLEPSRVWRDAKTDPPKSKGNYLVYCPGMVNRITVAEFNMSWWMDEDSADTFVTHWTDLPTPP